MTSGIDHLTRWQQLAQPLSLNEFGPTVVLSPHPDDESLGCGGTIAQLHRMKTPVQVIMVSDGSKSHPNSQKYPADRLRALRENETREALRQLGLSENQVTFMRLPDGAVPDNPESMVFQDASGRLATLLKQFSPQTVLLPWRRDPHRDHRATYRLLQGAVYQLANRPRILECPIWLWELGGPDDAPQVGEVQPWTVDISAMQERKRRAIAAHASQVTQLIDDDPQAFWLRPDLLVYFEGQTELFFESR